MYGGNCGWWVGPIWKLDGEVCVCSLEPDHDGPHTCTCGATFDGCGHPPGVVRLPDEPTHA